ncbi:6-phosphogluconate dehydrogenase, decarboxylating [bacterium BMS3Bbin06]|nr:6-phosphogluconate dehydrogenase, decarboxylating [bacterium BMS3Abin08]GBE34830.1 6-phosphogluconate dehydrogenase, decarboxylating [bacterium BMS3Bbin06]HDO34786.1 decarboxylating 6-phosphogluconate dehydrogenase [Nitrospirota bacterium]HDY71266.1 decarboxylating 6-phosphogluconate dehydrogenase [Nitrospirota bacterium]
MYSGMVGLGRMGMNMARRLIKGGHTVIAYNRTPDKTRALMEEGADGAFSLEELVHKLPQPRVIWLMLPAGETVDSHISMLGELLSEGDIIIDGGNTDYRDDIRRAGHLKERGIELLDVGVSGGVWGLKEGYCLMAGGSHEKYRYVEPLLRTLAPPEGLLFCGKTGAGHYVKMIHNGIEYAMMQAYAEGFDILNASEYSVELDFSKLAHLWNRGSVIRSWLLELLEDAFSKDPRLEGIRGYVEDSGEGRWTVREAIDLNVPAETITMSLFKRFRSRQEESFSDRILAALRAEFGGHRVIKIED